MTADKTVEGASLAAAQAAAREHGVACDEAVTIAAGSNVLVPLKPAPVVARVMTGTAVLHDDVEQWLAREVAVGAFLPNAPTWSLRRATSCRRGRTSRTGCG